ncbi:MAG TPA: nuclear transport factor 2 family protein [Burkholderiaceae bacterium]|jgi:hypothetical protein|nr:nuclear transport factor 2 family protein [Burkholderiaceae bacterium]
MTASDAGAGSPGRAQPQPAEVLERIRSGYERRDAALLASLYADDAEFTIVNPRYPPSQPLVLRGRASIHGMFDDLCSRSMAHRLESGVAGDERLAYASVCEYPDGCRVMTISVASLAGGHIRRETSICCWDD